MITNTNKVYGFENENALRQWLSTITTQRGRTIKPDAFAKMIFAFKVNKIGFKIKLLNNYKLKYQNVNEAIDYLIAENNTTTLKGNNDMKGIETLNLYIKNYKDGLRKEYDKKTTDLKMADTNYKAFVKAQDKMNELIDTKKFGKINELDKFEKISDETKSKLVEAKEEFEGKIVEADNFYNEVKARLADTTTKEEADNILTVYHIIDAEGKLN